MPDPRRVTSILTGLSLLFQTLFLPLAGSSQTSKNFLVRVCVARILSRTSHGVLRIPAARWTLSRTSSETTSLRMAIGVFSAGSRTMHSKFFVSRATRRVVESSMRDPCQVQHRNTTQS